MKTTEQDSLYNNLENMSFRELLININKEDSKVPGLIKDVIPDIEKLITAAYNQLINGGRLFYIGSGTSGRLGIVDASECPPTFGVDSNLVIGIIAGGDTAIRKAVEDAEDDFDKGWIDLTNNNISEKDFVIGISSSGNTPYVVGAIMNCNFHNIPTGCITSNKNSPLSLEANFPVEIVTGPEFVTGSTRMKAGTAQKLILNMISTSLMIKLGHIWDNKMIDMQLKNKKLIERGSKLLAEKLNIKNKDAKQLLIKHGSVRKAYNYYKNSNGTVFE
ncbi:MAG: N-acetylmuramic acid 6-phosphate etherase [Marinilabiliales bacterium]